MSNRLMKTLKAADGSTLILLTTQGKLRADGEPNEHRMFRVEQSGPLGFSFRHVYGPWVRYTNAQCLEIVDINQDGLDDIIICNKDRYAFIFLQDAAGGWSRLEINKFGWYATDWSNARVADVTGDGVNDLIVVGRLQRSTISYVRIFKGMKEPPYYYLDSRSLVYQRISNYSTPDLEILDVNGDGVADIYLVQTDTKTIGSYCYTGSDTDLQGGKLQPAQQTEFTHLDLAPDLLLVGSLAGPSLSFTEVPMEHAEPGCGYKVDLFGNNHTMILAQGDFFHRGHNLLLQW